MNRAQLRDLVRLHPKRIGEFTRDRQFDLARTTHFNFMLYRHPDGYYGASVGDGVIYRVKSAGADQGPKVLIPDLNWPLS